MNRVHMTPIGVIHSCFKEKFGIPRQAGLVEEVISRLEILPPYDRDEAFRGLTDFSHVWISYLFHGVPGQWRTMVRPPRLGGNRSVGVFASRSPFRPNRLGLSCVALQDIQRDDGRLFLVLRGGDFLDQTPVVDVKPYLPYADCLPHARGGYASEAPCARFQVFFSAIAREACLLQGRRLGIDLLKLLEKLLSYDPRPGYQEKTPSRSIFWMRLFDFEIRFRIEGDRVQVMEITR